MNRISLFAHFDAQDSIKPFVLEHLARLRAVGSRIVFVTTARLDETELAKLRPLVDTILPKDNIGYDFGMWKHALEVTDLGDCDELVLTNSSIVGPIYPLEPIFARMGEEDCDFWGMTDNFEHRWHLQSYFLVFKRKVFSSQAFREFFQSVLPWRGKGPVVLSYEVGLTSFLVENGFRPGVFVSTEKWATRAQRLVMDLERRWNPTLFHPEKLLSLGMPYVKLMLLRDNIGDVPLAAVYEGMRTAGYDLDLIELDRPSRPRPRTLRARARRLWQRIAPEAEGREGLWWPERRAG